jgi:hypothetical protein
VVDVSDEWEYPDWVESETWDPIDRGVFEGPNSLDPHPAPLGSDALAWYVSFHFAGSSRWGIFIPVSSLGYFENRVFQGLAAPRARKWQLAYDALLAHEQMHFAVDYACAQWEILMHTPSWASLLDRRRAQSVSYLKTEEQLANAFMLQCSAVWKPKRLARRLQDFVSGQPAGYRDGLSAVDGEAFEHAVAEVLKAYIALHAHERGLMVNEAAYDLACALPTRGGMAKCPVHVVHDEKRLGLPQGAVRLITRICNIRENEHFRRRFDRLDRATKKRWSKMKEQLSAGVPRSARLEKIRGRADDVFSVRVGNNFRVHLQPDSCGGWQATDIGSHKEMGHG